MSVSEVLTYQNPPHTVTNYATAPYEYKYSVSIGGKTNEEQVELFFRAAKKLEEIAIAFVTDQKQLPSGQVKQTFTFTVKDDNIWFKEFRYNTSLDLRVDRNTWDPKSFTLWRIKKSSANAAKK